MTDDQIRSRLREALQKGPLQLYPTLDRLVPFLRDLLSAETQQIREERDALVQAHRKAYRLLSAAAKRTAERAEQAVAETQALREALEKCLSYEAVAAVCQGLSGCTCINQSGDTERNYETGNCVHQKANVTLQRLTPASPRTGETEKTGQK